MKPVLVILAGGMGSRYGGLKQLDGVGPQHETIIDFSVYDAIRAGFGKVVLIVQESVVEQFKAKISSRFDQLIDVAYAVQPMQPVITGLGRVVRSKPWGTGHALLAAKDAIEEPFAVINADDYYGRSSFKIMADFLRQQASPECFAMVGFKLDKTLSENGSVSRGICTTDQSGNLKAVVERTEISANTDKIYDQSAQPALLLSGDDPVSMNFWGFDPSVFARLESHFLEFAQSNCANPTAEFYIPSFVNDLLKSKQVTVRLLESREQWYGVTYADDKPRMQQAIAEMVEQKRYDNPLWKR
ncbi:hypothetical protein AB833_00100 [Chromatiales bacterium (ex Bugula neritina AB1)]|nr:hypothetical protein AB833_00100 [Chromatiales bacterium (ex Bugula neritina AB1)]